MITTARLSAKDESQLERKELARGAWREGNIDNALLLIRSVLSEEMSPSIAAECYSAEAGFLADAGDFRGSLASLDRMAPHLKAADVRIQGTFYNGRGRAHRNLGNLSAALIDYTGALSLWQIHGDRNYEGAARINLAECYLRLNDFAEARTNIDLAIDVLPASSEYLPDAYDTKAKVLLCEGRPQMALEAIDTALEMAGSNELKLREFQLTKSKIKERLLDLLVPIVSMRDLDELKVQAIRNALDQADGSVTSAAKMLGTSHQVVAYIADQNSLQRIKRKKSIIKSFT